MNMEMIFKGFEDLVELAEKEKRHLHIGETTIQNRCKTVKFLDENIGNITEITHDLGLYSATEEKIAVKYADKDKIKTFDFFIGAKHLHIYKEKEYKIEGHLTDDKTDYIIDLYIPERYENGEPVEE